MTRHHDIAKLVCLFTLLAGAAGCGDDATTGSPGRDAGGPDAGTDRGDSGLDGSDDELPPGTARWTRPDGSAALRMTVDDSANGTYRDGEMEWNGSFIYDATTNVITFSSSWLPGDGPFPPLYDDGPYTEGGHEAAEAVAGDHVFEAEVFVVAEEATSFEYGLINELDDWIWTGPNATVTVEAGSTETVVGPGQTFEAFGSIDLRIELDTSHLHRDFDTFEADGDALFIKGTMISWHPVQLLDNGERGDAAAGDGIFTFTLSEYLGPHDGLLRLGQEAQFVYVFFEAGGLEYKVEGNAVPNGVTAFSNWSEGEFVEEELLLRSDSRGQALNTAILVGPDDSQALDPVLRFVEPDRGPTTGGTPAQLSGENFQVGAVVTFEDVEADCDVQSAAIITCSTPARQGAGTVAVTVTNPDGGSDTHQLGFTYIDVSSAPRITSLSPNHGTELGGTVVTIGGGNFVTGASVTFGGELATGINVAGGGTITATTPLGTPGPVDVEVRNTDSQAGTLRNGFNYDVEGIDFATIQWPTSTVVAGADEALPLLFGRVYEAEVTEAEGQGAGVTAEVVIGPDGTNPTNDFTDWQTFSMVYNTDLGNDDEYKTTEVTLQQAGVYDWAVRFSLDGGSSWTYGDLDGSINGYSPAQAGSIVVTDGIRVDGLDPDAISVLGAATIAVSGSGFDNEMTVEARPTGGEGDFVALDATVDGSTDLTLSFADPGEAQARTPGRFDLRLGLDDDVLTVTDAYLVGFVATPTVDGTVGADWNVVFRHSQADRATNWTGNALSGLYAAFDEDGLSLALRADLQRNGNVLLVYVDTDYGTGRGFTDMSAIADEDEGVPASYWRLDRAITSEIDAGGVEGFGADFAFGTFELEPLEDEGYLDALTGWRRLVAGDNWWYTLDDPCTGDNTCVSGTAGGGETRGTVETFVSWEVLYGQAGPPPGGQRIALFARIVNRWGDFISNQALPPEPDDDDPWNVTDVVVLDVR